MITEPPSPPTPGESLDDVESKRRFSQEHCEPEDSHTGHTVRKVPNEGTRTPSGWQWWPLVPKIPPMNTKKWLGFFSPQSISRSCQPFFFPRTFANVDKILPPPKKFVTLLQIQTVFVGGSNERPGLPDTINIAHVFNKDVFAYKCPLPFLCLQIFALVATVVILHWLNCLTVPVENAKSRYPMCSCESQTFLCPFLNFSRRQNNYPVMQCCLGGVGVVGWGGSRLLLSVATKRSASPCQFCSSGSCSSRSWCVSQEAGGVRLWR